MLLSTNSVIASLWSIAQKVSENRVALKACMTRDPMEFHTATISAVQNYVSRPVIEIGVRFGVVNGTQKGGKPINHSPTMDIHISILKQATLNTHYSSSNRPALLLCITFNGQLYILHKKRDVGL